ncbi:MAG TPA: DUF3455 domain-containing protein [Gemmatimonadales bacterium]|nr:DUF3455 domain-containing protein [Gemmatimonadales bacterium]
MTRLALLALAAAVALPAAAAIRPPSGVSARLQPSPAEEPAFMLSASGVHIFECRAFADGYAWAFTAPDATLYEGGRSVGTLSSVNLFESSSDRSSVSGVVRAVQPNGGNLPLALLRAIPTSEAGLFAGVTSVQRVNTAGGVAPAGGCGEDNAGAEARVGFTADYYFYKRRAG